MSSRDLSQFSPNLQAPTPTMATLSLMEPLMLVLLGEPPRAPEHDRRLAMGSPNIADPEMRVMRHATGRDHPSHARRRPRRCRSHLPALLRDLYGPTRPARLRGRHRL